jgi:hypothetical protein
MPAGGAKLKSAEGGGSGKTSDKISEQAFWSAIDKVGQGTSDYKFAKIAYVRRELGWSKDDFDNMVKKMRDNGLLQLQDGDTDHFTKQDIRDAFVDENGFRMLTMMKRPGHW